MHHDHIRPPGEKGGAIQLWRRDANRAANKDRRGGACDLCEGCAARPRWVGALSLECVRLPHCAAARRSQHRLAAVAQRRDGSACLCPVQRQRAAHRQGEVAPYPPLGLNPAEVGVSGHRLQEDGQLRGRMWAWTCACAQESTQEDTACSKCARTNDDPVLVSAKMVSAAPHCVSLMGDAREPEETVFMALAARWCKKKKDKLIYGICGFSGFVDLVDLWI